MEEEVVKAAFKVAPRVIAVTSTLAFFSGAGLATLVVRHQLKKKYEKLAADEIAEAKEHYARLHKKDEFATPQKAAEALLVETELTPVVIPPEVVETIKSYGGDPRPQLTSENIFQREPIPERTLVETSEKFVSPVNPHGAYVITLDEYTDGEVGYAQTNLTYYLGDDVLADENDQPIEDPTYVVGDALSRFGEGSGHSETVFVRNSKTELDHEITRSMGKYSVEVAGLPDQSLQHSAERIPRRRRALRDE